MTQGAHTKDRTGWVWCQGTGAHWVWVCVQNSKLSICVKDPRAGWSLLAKVTPILFLRTLSNTALAAMIK